MKNGGTIKQENNVADNTTSDKIKAKLKFKPNSFEVIKDGDYVECAVSGKSINLSDLSY